MPRMSEGTLLYTRNRKEKYGGNNQRINGKDESQMMQIKPQTDKEKLKDLKPRQLKTLLKKLPTQRSQREKIVQRLKRFGRKKLTKAEKITITIEAVE